MDITNEVSLRARIEELLVFKRSSGYKADGLSKVLHRFINYAEESQYLGFSSLLLYIYRKLR